LQAGLRRGPRLRGRGGPVGTVTGIRINASAAAPAVTAQAGILSINEIGDMLAMKSGYEESCKRGARVSERTFASRTIFKNRGAMQSNFVLAINVSYDF